MGVCPFFVGFEKKVRACLTECRMKAGRPDEGLNRKETEIETLLDARCRAMEELRDLGCGVSVSGQSTRSSDSIIESDEQGVNIEDCERVSQTC